MENGKIVLAGFGGQGILFAGKMLAITAMMKEKQLSWLPSYGPEMRGGTCNCHVVIDDEPVASPIVANPNLLIAMNAPSLDKFEDSVEEGGYIFVDSSLIPREVNRTDVKAVYIPATETATRLGNRGLANMVILGAVLKATGLFSLDDMRATMDYMLPPKRKAMAETNLQAIQAGYDAV